MALRAVSGAKNVSKLLGERMMATTTVEAGINTEAQRHRDGSEGRRIKLLKR